MKSVPRSQRILGLAIMAVGIINIVVALVMISR